MGPNGCTMTCGCITGACGGISPSSESSVCHLLILPSPLTPGNQWASYSLHTFACSRMSYSWTHAGCSPFSLSAVYLVMRMGGSTMAFHNLIAQFLSVLNTISPSRYTTVHLLIHLLKDIMAASKFRKDEQSCCKYLCTSVCADRSFQSVWVSNKESVS